MAEPVRRFPAGHRARFDLQAGPRYLAHKAGARQQVAALPTLSRLRPACHETRRDIRVKLLLDRLTGTPSAHDFEAPPSWWREWVRGANEGPYEVVAPFHFVLEAHRMGEDVYLQGTVQGELEVECSRCVSRYRHGLRESFSLVLEPARNRIPADPESAEALKRFGLCLGDEIEAGWFRGGEIELDAYFAELVALGMPVQPLCREDCRGLCPICGAALDAEECTCDAAKEAPKPESPFAVLAALKDGMQGD
jgi:uncharacterized protein